jgi:GIY-YIG catalytic domain
LAEKGYLIQFSKAISMKTNKELTQEYKLIKPVMGVFQIKNEQNGKIFIGSSTDLRAIWNRFKVQLNFNSHRDKMMQADWNEVGESHFTFTILAEIEHQETSQKVDYAKEVKTLEEMFIEELQPFEERGYHKKKLT